MMIPLCFDMELVPALEYQEKHAESHGDRTLVIVTHDRRFLTRDDVVLEIEDGHLKNQFLLATDSAAAAT
jgi:ABC-type lipoprotein export system ATPase subunit